MRNCDHTRLVVYFRPFSFYLFGRPVSAVWARLFQKFLEWYQLKNTPDSDFYDFSACLNKSCKTVSVNIEKINYAKQAMIAIANKKQCNVFARYSWGSKSEHVPISDGRACSVHGPIHSKPERKILRLTQVVLFIYSINLIHKSNICNLRD